MAWEFTAAITAGGRSSRFGSDKALATLHGRPLLHHVAASLQGCPVRLLVSPPGRYVLPGWQEVADTRPGQGPLAGLEAALSAAQTEWLAFTGVDLPGLTPGFWEALAQARTPGALAVLPLDEAGRPQPLAGLYHRNVLPRVTALLDAGERRLRLAAPPEQGVFLGGLSGALRNVNTPEALAAIATGRPDPKKQ